MKKKLKLGKLEIASEEVIERSQLSNIFGGSGGSVTGWCYLIGSDNSVIDTLDSFDPNLSQSEISLQVGAMCYNMRPVCQNYQCNFF